MAEDFESLKSRLRKVSKSVEDCIESSDIQDNNSLSKTSPTAETENCAEHNGKEKRSSTGSITNLKRLWESQRNVQEAGVKSPKSITKEPSESPSANNLMSNRVPTEKALVNKSEHKSLKATATSENTATSVKDHATPSSSDNKPNKGTNLNKSIFPNPKTENKPVKVKRVWPPPGSSSTDHDKPAIPIKPFVSKKTNPIYATPSQRVDHSNRSK